MATRANIAIQNEDGTFDCIYTHWDGADHLPILKLHYNSEESARQLVELGSISVLGDILSPEPSFIHMFNGYNHEDRIEGIHDSAGRQLGVTLAYHRDRGDELEIQRELRSRKACAQQEYLYVYYLKSGWRRFKVYT